MRIMAFLQLDYKSEALMRGVNVKVILPSDGMAGKWEPPYKTLYLLPGYSATATELITYLGLRGQSELKGIAIVLPDGENLFYQDMPDRMTFYSTYVGKELVEVARKLREDSQEALIIFVSNDAKCVFDVFEVFTFAFLLKPLTYNKFSTTLYNAFNYLYRTKRLFLFSYRKCNYSILCQSILYIEKLGRKAFIHTTDARVYQCNITLEKIWEQLNPSKFAAIHISCIVNLTEIASIKCDQLKLKNNEVLYVAKKYRQEIKSRHLQNLKIKKL